MEAYCSGMLDLESTRQHLPHDQVVQHMPLSRAQPQQDRLSSNRRRSRVPQNPPENLPRIIWPNNLSKSAAVAVAQQADHATLRKGQANSRQYLGTRSAQYIGVVGHQNHRALMSSSRNTIHCPTKVLAGANYG
jgi:hypothetical protein